MLLDVARSLKNAVLPEGSRYRRVLFGPASGCQMQLDLQHQLLIYVGLYEIELASYFRKLVRHGFSCFDVGGAGGYDALMMAKLSGGPVVSMECDHAAAEELRATFDRNGFPVTLVEKFICNRADATHAKLDDIAAETFTPDFIKMDIEGAEDEALLGAAEILRRRQPSLILEVHGQEKEVRCRELLEAAGYRIKVVDRRSWLPERRPMDHNRWLIAEGRPTQSR